MKNYLTELKSFGASFKRDKRTGSYVSTFKEWTMEISADFDGNGIYYNMYRGTDRIGGDGGKDSTMRSIKIGWLGDIKDHLESGEAIKF
tara:strand:+ start:27177 stop:27443 length:267 start_codon:yes stop_codon:yes gene_type:complete